MNPIKIITVVGPTASGKTGLGLELAARLKGEIVSADSMQIYRLLDIGTAKPDQKMLEAVPHHLIDILDPARAYNAGQYRLDATAVIKELNKKGVLPIVLGGTFLYVKALVHGIVQVPDIWEGTKAFIADLMEKEGLPGCYKLLTELDPESAKKLHNNDISRVLRALEVVKQTGKSILKFQEEHQFKDSRFDSYSVAINWSREELYSRINQRTLEMVNSGLLEETRRVLEMGYSPELPSLQAIGYKQAIDCLEGKISEEEMISEIQQKTRRYAKKQLTWARKDKSIHWIEPTADLSLVTEEIKNFLAE